MAMQSSLKNMTLCLFVICLVCSSLLAGSYALTKAPIEAADKLKTEKAIKAVLPDTFTTLSDKMTVALGDKNYNYYEAKDENGLVGYAIESHSVGFGGQLKVMVGITADGVIFNTSVLAQSETPGLGAKCTEPVFADQFKNVNPAEKKLAVKKDQGDFDAITASTITSRAYIKAVKTAVDVFAELNK